MWKLHSGARQACAARFIMKLQALLTAFTWSTISGCNVACLACLLVLLNTQAIQLRGV